MHFIIPVSSVDAVLIHPALGVEVMILTYLPACFFSPPLSFILPLFFFTLRLI